MLQAIQDWSKTTTTVLQELAMKHHEIEHIPFFLRHARMDADCREVAFAKQLVQLCCPANALHKYHNLVEIKGIQEIV
jgi:hypothetical protein